MAGGMILWKGLGMARPLRIEYAGAYYHVLNRGNRREIVLAGRQKA